MWKYTKELMLLMKLPLTFQKRPFSQSLTRLCCCFWSSGRLFFNLFTYFNWLLDGPKILVTTPPPHPIPGPSSRTLSTGTDFPLTVLWNFNFFLEGGGRDPVRWVSTLYDTRFHYTYKERSAHRRHTFSQNCWQSSFTSIVSRRNYCISIGFCKTTHQPLP